MRLLHRGRTLKPLPELPISFLRLFPLAPFASWIGVLLRMLVWAIRTCRTVLSRSPKLWAVWKRLALALRQFRLTSMAHLKKAGFLLMLCLSISRSWLGIWTPLRCLRSDSATPRSRCSKNSRRLPKKLRLRFALLRSL